jgi:hypothetical protein
MASSEELFDHAYQDGLQALARNRLENEVQLRDAVALDQRTTSTTPQFPKLRAHRVLHELYDARLREVHNTLASGHSSFSGQEPDRPEPERPHPEAVFARGLRCLHRIEEFRSLLANFTRAGPCAWLPRCASGPFRLATASSPWRTLPCASS